MFSQLFSSQIKDLTFSPLGVNISVCHSFVLLLLFLRSSSATGTMWLRYNIIRICRLHRIHCLAVNKPFTHFRHLIFTRNKHAFFAQFAQFCSICFCSICSLLLVFIRQKYCNYLCINILQDTPLFCEQIEQKQIEQIAFFYVSRRFQIISIIYIIINNIFIYIYY